MLNSVKGMVLTLFSTFHGLRQPVTRQYPTVPTPVQPRFMGFPALTWDYQVEEPYCTGCMVCIRNCPTQCMSASMKDNPLNEEGKSSRRKIVDYFEINLNRCILCGICVEVCNFDAIVMSHEHEMSTYQRNGDRVALPALLEIGTKFQKDTNWIPPTVIAKAKKDAEDAAKDAAAASTAEGAAESQGEEAPA
ncbi:MAG: 4Fe-4S dicluster domain-containing protein [Dehalococcoidia bacterium]